MQHFLSAYYGLTYSESITIAGRTGYKSNEYIYFTMISDDNKGIYKEQTALAYHLVELGYYQTTVPVPNVSGYWMTLYEGKEYVLLEMIDRHTPSQHYSHGQLLAQFHEGNTSYPYEPKLISSYGKWKQLWIEKLSAYEQRIKEEAANKPCLYYDQLMDVLPYFIGVSENAIQYIQESEHGTSFNQVDQATITFQRYDSDILKEMIWMNDLSYDHPIRDIAEYIRKKLLLNNEQGLEECWLFLKEYDAIRSLSSFSWRMLFARLLFPIHFYDLVETGFSTNTLTDYDNKLTELCMKQTIYEQSLRRLFEVIGLNDQTLQIPMLKWL